VRKKKISDTLKHHLLYPFSIPYPGRDRTYFSSGFCESDEITTIYKRSVVEGDSDVCSVECSVCGGPVITYKNSNLLTSTYSPEIVGCLIQKDKTLCFVVEAELSQSDSKTLEAVILDYLAKHDFTAYFQTISVYRSGVNSSLKKKVLPKRSLLFSQELKCISPRTQEDTQDKELPVPEVKAAQEEEHRKWRAEMAESAGKLLVELQKLSILPESVQKEISSIQTPNSQKKLKRSPANSSKQKKISHPRSMKKSAISRTKYG
jgi:hypothetical protein